MHHIIRGNLQGSLCDGFSEPLSSMRVRLYRPGPSTERRISAGDPLQYLFFLQSEPAVRQKKSRLIAETRTDAQGRYAFDLDDTHDYNGEAVEIDVQCHSVPHQPADGAPTFSPVQFTITALDPFWRATDSGLAASWDCMIPSWFWCAIRARFNARVICGRVASRKTGFPLAGVRVRVAIPDQDENKYLGAAVTDTDGGFRIDFKSNGNQGLTLPAWLDQDSMSGQVFSFLIEATDGESMLTSTLDQECVMTANQVNASLNVDLMPVSAPDQSMLPPVRTVMYRATDCRHESVPLNPMVDPMPPALLSLSFP